VNKRGVRIHHAHFNQQKIEIMDEMERLIEMYNELQEISKDKEMQRLIELYDELQEITKDKN
jgi:hypothetical protein